MNSGLTAGTAVITGASSGIGAAFARQLAARRYDLLLIARRAERLDALAADLGPRHACNVWTLPADLADPVELSRVADHLGEMSDIVMLVHSAGFGSVGKFAEKEIESQLAMVQVHDVAALRLTRAVLPDMVHRHRGAIIHLSSIAAWSGSGGSVTYAASKAFLNTFCEGLQAEVEASGVRIQALCPGLTYSEFHDTPEFADFQRSDFPGSLWMTADEVVRQSLKALRGNQVIVVPGKKNRLFVELSRYGPVRAAGHKLTTRLRNRHQSRASTRQDAEGVDSERSDR